MARSLLGVVPWLPRGRLPAAYLAALGLVIIQVGIGIIMKVAQTGESYSFSPSGSVAISESCKLLLSTLFFLQECKRRSSEGRPPSTLRHRAGYLPVPVPELPLSERSSEDEKRDTGSVSSYTDSSDGSRGSDQVPAVTARLFWSYIQAEVSTSVRWGYCNLALLYVLINNTIFISYKIADPGTIQLVKSGVTFITALVMMATLGTRITRNQWLAIALQASGLAVTQYSPGTGTSYPITTYLVLLFQVFIGALAGVYNQALLKSDDSSLHAGNMILYTAGACLNFGVHLVIRALKYDEPHFFAGYNSFGSIMVVVSNVFIGLAITAVYKYADALIKCLATAVATGILLYISPILFHTRLGLLALPGAAVVFFASWLYMVNQPPPNPDGNPPQKGRLFSRLSVGTKKAPATLFGISTFLTITIVAFLTLFDAKPPVVATDEEMGILTNQTVSSPFQNTLAMIRWNAPLTERVPLLQKYEPFFHTVHISMPNKTEIKEPFRQDLKSDNNKFLDLIYMQAALTMQEILDEQPSIDGLLFFHFDAWIDPLRFKDMNRENIWLAVSDSPRFLCMTDRADYGYWHRLADGFRVDKSAILASEVVDKLNAGYKINKDEFCVGWSDIYFVPRRFFKDFILLAAVFARIGTFHEVALPTMLNIIKNTRQTDSLNPVFDTISDCWGSCCASYPTVQDVFNNRCGHRLEYRDTRVATAYYNKLDRQAELLHTAPSNVKVPGFADESPLKSAKLRASVEKAKAEADFELTYVEVADDMNRALDEYLAST